MTDMSALVQQFAEAVGQQLDDRETSAVAKTAEANLITALLAKPLLHLPDDLMVLCGCEKSTAYKIMGHDDFPATFTLGRQRFCRTDEFMEALPVIGKPTPKTKA